MFYRSSLELREAQLEATLWVAREVSRATFEFPFLPEKSPSASSICETSRSIGSLVRFYTSFRCDAVHDHV